MTIFRINDNLPQRTGARRVYICLGSGLVSAEGMTSFVCCAKPLTEQSYWGLDPDEQNTAKYGLKKNISNKKIYLNVISPKSNTGV